MMMNDGSTVKHENARVVEYGGRRFVCEVLVNKERRFVTVLCAPALGRIAGALAEKVLAENGWRCGGGSAFGFCGRGDGSAFASGQGRWRVTEYAR